MIYNLIARIEHHLLRVVTKIYRINQYFINKKILLTDTWMRVYSYKKIDSFVTQK